MLRILQTLWLNLRSRWGGRAGARRASVFDEALEEACALGGGLSPGVSGTEVVQILDNLGLCGHLCLV